MSRAITLSFDTGVPWDDNPYGDAAAPVDDTGDFVQILSSFFGGGGGGRGGGGGIGGSLGTLAGTGLGSLFGPAGATIGANLGKIGGNLIESAIQGATRKPPARPPQKQQKRLTKHEQKILADGAAQTRKTGNPAFAEEAKLRVYRPAEYKRRRAAGTLPSQQGQTPRTPPSTPRVRFPKPPPTGSAQKPSSTPPPPSTRTRVPVPAAPPLPVDVAPPDEPELPDEEAWEEEEEYDDTGAPVATRPNPTGHISIVPLSDEYIAAALRDMPAMKDLDPRALRMISGRASSARDVAGVDASTGTYHATPNETPYGITKKLTGQTERVDELWLPTRRTRPACRPCGTSRRGGFNIRAATQARCSRRLASTLSRAAISPARSPKSSGPVIGAGGPSPRGEPAQTAQRQERQLEVPDPGRGAGGS